jgi:hypothetical protein
MSDEELMKILDSIGDGTVQAKFTGDYDLEAENAKLREMLRWRKWPEESPTETGYYIVWKFNLSYTPNGFYSASSDSWDVMWKRFYWMPQMPLPEVES